MSLRDRLLEQDLISEERKMSDPYATYVFGSDALQAFKLHTHMAEFSKRRFWRLYQSNWRILHIDGFEPGYGFREISFKWVTGVRKTPRFSDKL